MQAWGTGVFENESANDWLEDLIDSGDLDAIPMAMQGVLEFSGTDEIEAVDCAVALAAAEVVAIANNKPGRLLPPPALKFVEDHSIGVTKTTLGVARKTVETVREKSPLLSYWKGVGKLVEWLEELDSLSDRLQS